jgi:hypothetical protein
VNFPLVFFYTYDSNGNTTTDGLNALKLEYNFLNVTGVVRTTGGAIQAQYRWLADGSKVGVKDGAGSTGSE